MTVTGNGVAIKIDICYSQLMAQSSGKKQPRPVMAAVLVCAVLGTFAFSIVELPHVATENMPYSSGILASVDHAIDWLAEDTPGVNRANKTASSPLRSGLLRMLMPVIYSTGGYPTTLSAQAARTDHSSNSQDTIHIKLLI